VVINMAEIIESNGKFKVSYNGKESRFFDTLMDAIRHASKMKVWQREEIQVYTEIEWD